MTSYRTYRGLYGETIRVPESTVVPAPRIHNREAFPFVTIAKRAGEDRDRFASNCRYNPLIEDAIARRVRRRAPAQTPVSFAAKI